MKEITKRKILVVDDEINVCKSIQQAIISEEYEVDTALSGEEALKKEQKRLYDLIITDLMMPGISGLDLLVSLKSTRPGVIVVMITGYPTIKTAVQSIKIGAFDYIPKPFTPKELRSLVFRAFKSLEYDREDKQDSLEPQMPADLFLMRGHTWLRKEEKDRASVGIVFDFIKNIGTITNIDLLSENKNVFQGEVCARLTDAGEYIHRVWSPVSGRIIKVNKNIKDDLFLLKKDPYQKGWLFQVESVDLEKDLEEIGRAHV